MQADLSACILDASVVWVNSPFGVTNRVPFAGGEIIKPISSLTTRVVSLMMKLETSWLVLSLGGSGRFSQQLWNYNFQSDVQIDRRISIVTSLLSVWTSVRTWMVQVVSSGFTLTVKSGSITCVFYPE